MQSLPHNPEGEGVLLSYALSGPDRFKELIERGITSEDFYIPRNIAVARSMAELTESNIPVTEPTLMDRLRQSNRLSNAGGLNEITALMTALPQPAEVVNRYVKEVQDLALRRGAIFSLSEAVQELRDVDKSLDEVQWSIQSRIGRLQRGQTQLLRPAEAVLRYRNQREQDLAHPRTWARTYIEPLDAILPRFRQNDYVMWGARPGNGKSSALRFAFYRRAVTPIPINRHGIVFFSFEETAEEVIDSLVSLETGIPNEYLSDRYLDLTDEKRAEIELAENKIARSPFYIVEAYGMSVAKIASKAAEYKRLCLEEHGVPVTAIAVDYIQKMTHGQDQGSRSANMASISAAIRNLAMPGELDLEVHAAVQLNREGAKGPATNESIAESDALTRDATKIIFLQVRDTDEAELMMYSENIRLRTLPTGQMVRELRTPIRVKPVEIRTGKVRRGASKGFCVAAWDASTNRYFRPEYQPGEIL